MSRLRGAIRRLKSGTYTVTRTATGTRVDGKYIPGAVTTLSNVVASVQPVTGKELQDVSEGKWTNETIQLWTTTRLYSQEPPQDPDVIAYNGSDYVVMKVLTHESFNDRHYIVFAARSTFP